MDGLTVGEALKEEYCCHFTGAAVGPPGRTDGWVAAYVHRRKGWGDDLVLRCDDDLFGRPAVRGVVLAKRKLGCGAVFRPDAAEFATVADDALVVGSTATGKLRTLRAARSGEGFRGAPRWHSTADGWALLAVIKGADGLERLTEIDAAAEKKDAEIFVASKGGSIGSFASFFGEYAVTHRLANAMIAEVVLVQGASKRLLAIDLRVEYAAPALAYLRSGHLVARFGGFACLVQTLDWDTFAADPRKFAGEHLACLERDAILHGVFALAPGHDQWVRVKASDDGDRWDFAARTYGPAVAPRDLVLARDEDAVLLTARRVGVDRSIAESTHVVAYADGRFSFDAVEIRDEFGSEVPLALAGGEVLFLGRSPAEWGDLYLETDTKTKRLTWTMPLSLKEHVRPPKELYVGDVHCLVYWPARPSDAPVQAVVWAHGGPFCAHALEYFPLFHWLANLGFVVLVPHFEGSTSFGLDHMDAVRGDGCGVADLEGALAAGRHARDGHLRCDGYRVDVERGVAIAGHSWGGYLALLAATRPRDSPFSCAVASAGIADWAAQQRGTDVRYYDRWLMDGWVYEPAVAKRAARASPDPKALALPLLLVHGAGDTDVPFAQAKRFADRAAAAGADVETLFLEGEPHGMGSWSKDSQAKMMDATRKFLTCHLKPWDFTSNPHGDVTAY
jgi:acetyl esterase/lipase